MFSTAGWVELALIKKIKLTWPQNPRKPISEDLNVNIFQGRMPQTPPTGGCPVGDSVLLCIHLHQN